MTFWHFGTLNVESFLPGVAGRARVWSESFRKKFTPIKNMTCRVHVLEWEPLLEYCKRTKTHAFLSIRSIERPTAIENRQKLTSVGGLDHMNARKHSCCRTLVWLDSLTQIHHKARFCFTPTIQGSMSHTWSAHLAHDQKWLECACCLRLHPHTSPHNSPNEPPSAQVQAFRHLRTPFAPAGAQLAEDGHEAPFRLPPTVQPQHCTCATT